MASTGQSSMRACVRPRSPTGSGIRCCRCAQGAGARDRKKHGRPDPGWGPVFGPGRAQASREGAMNFKDRQVVVTGGTGALGAAVVGALLDAGAICHIPYRGAEEARRFAHREHANVTLVPLGDLADEAAVKGFYGSLSNLWASIH